MATISNTPRPGYVWDSTDNVWYPIGVGAHQHTNAADTPAVMPYSTYAAAGKNKVINGDFGVWQRGTSFTANSAQYTVDRWRISASAYPTTGTWSQQTFTPGTAPASGYEAQYFWRYAITTVGSSTDWYFGQRIEDVRTFAGQTATFSFWAKADTTRTIAVGYNQNFGSGGSGTVSGSVGTTYSLTTSWQRFSATVSLPSISGKTVGTSSYLEVFFQQNSALANGYTVDIWGVQLEAGSVATAFQTATGTLQGELAACQRYYTTSIPTGYSVTDFPIMGTTGAGGVIFTCSSGSTNDLFGTIQYPVTMRSTPTFTIYSGNNRTAGSVRDMVTGTDATVGASTPQTGQNKNFTYMGVGTYTTSRPYGFHYTASAEL